MRPFHFGLTALFCLQLAIPQAKAESITPGMGQPATPIARSSSLSETLIENLTFMRSVYQSEYAPAAWKGTFTGWNLDQEYKQAVSAAQAKPDLTLREAREILKTFIYSMKDYHVSIGFDLTEKATLPFVVKGAGSKLFIVDIDRDKLPESSFPFHIGDELAFFGGQSAADAVASVQAEKTANVEATDRALAEFMLTRRAANRGYRVPQGPVTIGIKPQGSSQIQYTQLIWDYTPEQVTDPVPLSSSSLLSFSANRIKSATSRLQLSHRMMDADVEIGEGSYDIGARKSFIPDLGVKIWETSPDNPFYAYLYKTSDRKLIGFVRIPSYAPEDRPAAATAFSQIIATFEAATDALVIDQVNNPGGSVSYLYALASMLTTQPLLTPQHEMSIVQADVSAALSSLKLLKDVKDDASAKKIMGETDDGYPISYEVAQFTVNFLRFIVGEWNAGRRLTRPYWLSGMDHINPNPIHYSKPILLLTNALDFSGGDFFPAIMQDNKRVTILGTRTAGAGGYVNDVSYPNVLGITRFRVTESIAKRVSNNPIENLGITPDIPYELTESDLTQNYSEYVKAIQSAVNQLTQ